MQWSAPLLWQVYVYPLRPMRTHHPRICAHLARHAFMQYSGLLFPRWHRFDHTERHGMDDRTTLIETAVIDRLSHVIDPELGRSVTDLGMIASVRAQPSGPNAYDVMVDVELTVPGCPLSAQISAQIEEAVASYPEAALTARITVGAMDEGKLQALVSDLKAQRRDNRLTNPARRHAFSRSPPARGGVGKSSISANLAATFAALGYDTAAIDADIYGFSLPRLFGTHSQPTNLNGMLMPVTAWGVKLMSIGMFAGSDRAILWRGPRLQRSLEQFLADVWWGEPDVLILDLAPGTGDMAISVAQALPNAELVVVTTHSHPLPTSPYGPDSSPCRCRCMCAG